MNNDVNKKYVLIAVTLSSFLVPFISSSINIALPEIGERFDMNAVLLGWIATSSLIASAIVLVPFGRIADMHGRKKIYIYGILLLSISSLLCALSTSATMLISFRVLQGMGGGMMVGTSFAIVTSVFPVGERGRALGIATAAVYVGLSVGPFIGGLLTEHFGWRSIFIANVPLGLLALAPILWKLKGDWIMAEGEKFDFAGSAIYGLMLIAIMYGFSLLPDISGAWLILAGFLALATFIWWEMRVKSPVLNIGLFQNNVVFALSNVAALISYSATFAVSFLLSLYLQYIKGFSPEGAGFILVSQPVVQAIFSPIAGRLSDRVEPRVLASVGMALTVVGLALFIFLGHNTSLAFIIAILILLGFGFALFSAPNTNAVMSSVEDQSYGVASATLATMRQIGMMLSMGIATLLFALYIGRVQITPEYYESFLRSVKMAFIVFACLCFAGVFASLARGKVR